MTTEELDPRIVEKVTTEKVPEVAHEGEESFESRYRGLEQEAVAIKREREITFQMA
ncbi:MAG: hypothetical protein Q7R79_05240 [bacterium]|nr:hypothetical protein [bacterium]